MNASRESYRNRREQLAYLEGPRALAEMASLVSAAPFLATAPRGDGHPVLVMPGFGGSDLSTALLRRYLTGQGLKAREWTLGRNLGPRMPNLQARLAARLHEVSREAGGQPVSLVGWSLGGVYARLLAHGFPEQVRQVITLGSPIGGVPRRGRAYRVMQRMSDGSIGPDEAMRLRGLASDPLPGVPSTALFSRTDAVVPWQIARQEPGPRAENIEVHGSHIGLGFNPAVLYAVVDRLAQKPGDWRPFARTGWKVWVYGRPEQGREAHAA